MKIFVYTCIPRKHNTHMQITISPFFTFTSQELLHLRGATIMYLLYIYRVKTYKWRNLWFNSMVSYSTINMALCIAGYPFGIFSGHPWIWGGGGCLPKFVMDTFHSCVSTEIISPQWGVWAIWNPGLIYWRYMRSDPFRVGSPTHFHFALSKKKKSTHKELQQIMIQ